MRRPTTEARVGRRLSLALNELGPTFIKFGQAVATRDDILPEELIRELCQLQDNVAPMPASAVQSALRAAYGVPIGVRFHAFDAAPLAAGSIAQVHRGRTHDGHEVVLKIRRAGIEQIIRSDLAVLRKIAGMVAARVPRIAQHDPVGMVEQFGASLLTELDFEREAACLSSMSKDLDRTARVPRVFPELCANGVLVMEYVPGTKVTDIADAQTRREVARGIIACFAVQILKNDRFHADPHAGNIVHEPGGDLVLLDLGAVGHVNHSMRKTLLAAALAAGRSDSAKLARSLLGMVHAPEELDRNAYERDVAGLLDALLLRPETPPDISALLGATFDVTRKHRLRIRSEYFLLMRTLLLVDGVVRQLDPTIDPVRATRSFVVRSWYRPRWFLPATLLLCDAGVKRAKRVTRKKTFVMPGVAVAALAALAIVVGGGFDRSDPTRSPLTVRIASGRYSTLADAGFFESHLRKPCTLRGEPIFARLLAECVHG